MNRPETARPAALAGRMAAWWRARLTARRRRTDWVEAAAEQGWQLEPWPGGVTLGGRTLSCRWTLHCHLHGGSVAMRFDMGSPDEHRVMLGLGTGRTPGVLAHAMAWPASRTPSLAGRFWLEAADAEDLARLQDAEMEALLAGWIGAAPGRADLQAWLSPHGVTLESNLAPDHFDTLVRTVRLGISLGRRAGLA